MSNNPRSVSLDVRNPDWPPPTPDWVSVPASNGNSYSYLYAGGDDGKGEVDFHVGQGRGSLTISFQPYTNEIYKITNVYFAGDQNAQLRFQITQNGRSVVITDEVTLPEEVKYTVEVTDTSIPCTVRCDPQIINRPD